MTTKYVQPGEIIDYTPNAAVAANAVVKLGILLGVACADIDANTTGALAIEGVFDLPKKAGAGLTFAAGDKLTYNATDGFIKGAGTDGDILGGAVAVAAALATDAVARVKLLPGTGSVVSS